MIFETVVGDTFEASAVGVGPTFDNGAALLGGGTSWPWGGPGINTLPVDTSKLSRRKSYRNVYLTNPWAWAAVNHIAKSFSRFPAQVSEPVDGRHGRSRTGAGAALEFAIRNPWDGRSGQAQQHALAVDSLVEGSAAWRLHRDTRSLEVVGFESVPWCRVTPAETEQGDRVYRISNRKDGNYDLFGRVAAWGDYWDGDDFEIVSQDDIIHFGFGSDPVDPLNPPSLFASLGATIALYDASLDHVLSFLGKGARLSGIVEVDPEISPAVLAQVKANIAATFSGTSNAGQIALSAGKFTPISKAPDHSKMMKLAAQSAIEIAAATGVPPPMIGMLEHANYSNVKELKELFQRDVAGTVAERASGDVIAQLARGNETYRRFRLKFDSSAVLRPDPAATAAMIPNLNQVKTTDELRADLYDLAPLPGGAGVGVVNPHADNTKESEPT